VAEADTDTTAARAASESIVDAENQRGFHSFGRPTCSLAMYLVEDLAGFTFPPDP
jgi:hypothetical protein